MLLGLYNCEGGSARELDAIRRLEDVTDAAELLVSGPLAVASAPAAPEISACVDEIDCILEGSLYEPAVVARDLGVPVCNQPQIVASAYRRAGPAMLSTVRGRFAVAVWDRRRQRGLLGCDVLAMRPLYVWRHGRSLLFATEIDELLRILPSTPGPDPMTFMTWLGGGYCPDGRTLFEGVSRLGPGQFIPLGGASTEPQSHWRARYVETLKGSREELAAGLRDELERAVSRRLTPGANGVELSGGVDSSIVTALGIRALPPGARLRTYSAVFPGRDFDESSKIRDLAAGLGIVPAMFRVEPHGILWLALQYSKRRQLPLSGVGALIDMPLAAEAGRDGTEVLLDGQTGDEVLGFSPYLIADRLMSGRLLSAIELTRRWPGGFGGSRETALTFWNFGVKAMAPHRLLRMVRTHRDLEGSGPRWLLPRLRREYVKWEDIWAWKRGTTGPLWWRFLADRLVHTPHRELRLDYLRHRATESGVASDSALYDIDLIEYVLRLPPDIAFDPELDRPLAREAMRGILPDQVRRQKQKADLLGFCVQVIRGVEVPAIGRLLSAPDAELGAYVDMEWLRKLWYGDWPAGRRNGYPLSAIWAFVHCELWLRGQADPRFLDDLLESPDVPEPSLHAVGHGSATAPFSH